MGSGTRSIGVGLAVGLVLVGVTQARAAVWSVHLTPFPSFGVSAVSCVSADACTAVGSGGAPNGTAAMGWDGRRWRMQATPDPDASPEAAPALNSLAGVSCTSAKACVAVGEYIQRVDYDPNAMKYAPVQMPLAERWDGVGWSVLPFPSLPAGAGDGGLGAVSCTSSSACMAVGSAGGLLAERWDGSTWTIESMPEPVAPSTTAGGMSISGLSCSSSSSCIAAGYYDPASGTGTQSFAERWDGSSWSLEPPAQIAGVPDLVLMGVSCTARSACTAVGQYDPDWPMPIHRTVAERWNGTGWSVQRTLDGSGDYNELTGVSCTSRRACVAVGFSYSNLGYRALVERWNGTRWSIERTPTAGVPGLQAVSCMSSVICMAIGGGPSGTVALQSVPASARLTSVPSGCTNAGFTVHVSGVGISSVVWSLDSKTIKGHAVRRGTRYIVSVRLSPGKHKLAVKVKFTASSQARPLTLRRVLLGCPPLH